MRRTRPNHARQGFASMHEYALRGQHARVEYANFVKANETVVNAGDDKPNFVHVRFDENARRLCARGTARLRRAFDANHRTERRDFNVVNKFFEFANKEVTHVTFIARRAMRLREFREKLRESIHKKRKRRPPQPVEASGVRDILIENRAASTSNTKPPSLAKKGRFLNENTQ